MIASRQGPSIGAERFPLAAVRERWLDFLAMEHATLPLPVDFEREGDQLLVRRAPVSGRKISEGRIPKEHAPLLFLQAAGLCSFLQAAGFWLAEEDLTQAVHDLSENGPRLWLTKTPASVAVGGPGPAPSAVLAAFLHRLFARARRLPHPAARSLFDRMLTGDAPFRRAEYWLASAFRSFPELREPAAAGSRSRTIGLAGTFLRDVSRRALLAKGRALCEGREARVFSAPGSALTPGAALGMARISGGAAEAARALRESHQRSAGARRPLWIAVERARWDHFSRSAFETAARALAADVEVRILDDSAPVPQLPDEWRREIFVPCGTLSGSLRFYERFAELARREPAAARSLAESLTAAAEWAAFAADPTGDAPLPLPRPAAGSAPAAALPALERELLEALAALDGPVAGAALARLFPRRAIARVLERFRSSGEASCDSSERWRITPSGDRRISLSPARRRVVCLRWAQVEEDPGRRIELLLEGGDVEEALAQGERWRCEAGPEAPERWFELSSRLAAAAGAASPVWLDLLEAEREVAGGRLEEARTRLLAIATSPTACAADKRRARLRAAETLSQRGRHGAAGGEAAAWRREFPDAPAGERVRALRVEAVSSAREGAHEAALRLLEEAEREGAAGSLEERLETGLACAGVYSLAGRFREEKEIFERWRGAVLEHGDDRLTARLLAREALGLSDRREFAASIARLEEALAVTHDDAVERARLSIDLATALYHSGRSGPCGALLEEAIALASAVGREDLVRIARGNRVELAIHRGEWEEACREIEKLLADAEAEKDDVRRLVALHQRSRVALRRGLLEEAETDNAHARGLASRLSDRLEVGELWLEEGDRALFAGDLEGAHRAWETAAQDPPDRCDTDLRARERLRELAWREGGGPPSQAVAELAGELAREEYASAERAARWRMLFGPTGAASELFGRAQEILRTRGGVLLADRVFGGATPPDALAAPSGPMRALRDCVAAALAGEEPEAPPLTALALSGLAIRDEEGREIARLGSRESGPAPPSTTTLAAGTARYELALWPAPPRGRAEAIALLLETLLYRAVPARPPVAFAEGWRRLGVVTGDASMEEPYRRLVHFAPQPVTVLVLGESGSGKEGISRAVHQLSPRASGAFVALNVPAIPAALLESELFGHARGAFTGADHDRRGLLEEAHGGTIFFDEIGDLSLPLQAKLLRALQEREIRRVGENRPRAIDVRVVSATSRPLALEVERGAFREDLYYRLHVAVIALPALRERGRDVILLARHFLTRFAKEYGRGDLQFSPEALGTIAAHAWPGNVRELQNAVAQAAALAEAAGVITPESLPETLRRDRRASAPPERYRSSVDAHRRDLITEALQRTDGNRTRAARDLGMSRQALLYLIRELNVSARPRSSH
jgi:DNA-binding NtrC family response regulator/tetratricopeptide (TPR) repeat protein